MAKQGSRSQAEERFQKAQRTDQEARSTVDAERDAVRKKTADLKALRLAQNAGAGKTTLDKDAAAPKAVKPKARMIKLRKAKDM